MLIVSVDDHVIEPPDMFEGREAKRFEGRFPRLVVNDAGVSSWVWEGSSTGGSASLNAVVTWPKSQWDLDPASHAEMRPGCYDLDARVDDMNVNGVAASMCFPTFPRFGGGFFSQCDDKDLAFAAVQAYNDWHLEDWCGHHPGRFMPLAIPASWDAKLSAQEVHRIAKLGFPSITWTENPTRVYDDPSLHSGFWDPFFAACEEEKIVISIHIGSSGAPITTSPDAPIDIYVNLSTMQTMAPMMDFMFSDVFVKFPGLKVALSEGGAGWIPYTLDRLDRHVQNQLWTGHRFTPDYLPSQCYRDHFLACIVADPAGLQLRERIGVDTLAIETDYPHSDSQWPHAPETFMKDFTDAGMSDEEIEKVTWQNASRFYGWDPFRHLSRQELTVGALRAQATHVDTSTTTKDEYRARYEQKAAV